MKRLLVEAESAAAIHQNKRNVPNGENQYQLQSDSFDLALNWKKSCVHEECTLHQLAPYIGKLKSSIAQDLILRFTEKDDLILDPFAGSGTVLLEAVRLGRKAYGIDLSPYAAVLSRGKLSAPPDLESALKLARRRLKASLKRPAPDRRKIPQWVRDFFHPQSLAEAINFSEECKKHKDDFLLSCLLGILHHQRPGFLSYPSSHLTPYLRDKKFPKEEFPELYTYRALEPRLIAKIERAYKRKDFLSSINDFTFIESQVERAPFPQTVNCVITSPPYMNALDYGRDNRLRLWFLSKNAAESIDAQESVAVHGFFNVMSTLAENIDKCLAPGGHCIVILADQVKRSKVEVVADRIATLFTNKVNGLNLVNSLTDTIPDIRRSRRDCRGVRTEQFLIFQRDHGYTKSS